MNFSSVASSLFRYSKSITGSGLLTAICPGVPQGTSLPSSSTIAQWCPGKDFPSDPGLISITFPLLPRTMLHSVCPKTSLIVRSSSLFAQSRSSVPTASPPDITARSFKS